MHFWHLFLLVAAVIASRIEIPESARLVLTEENANMLSELKAAHNLGEPTDPVLGLFFQALCFPSPGTPTHTLESITMYVCYFLDYLEYPEKALGHLMSLGASGTFYYRPERKFTTLIHDSLVLKNPALLKYTIETFGFNVNLKDYTGCTPLGLACKYGYWESAKLLVEKFGADYLPRVDGSNSLLHLSFENLENNAVERDEFVLYLVNMGIDVNACNEQGLTLAEYIYGKSIFMYCFHYPFLVGIGAEVLPAEVNNLLKRSLEVDPNSSFEPVSKRKRTNSSNK